MLRPALTLVEGSDKLLSAQDSAKPGWAQPNLDIFEAEAVIIEQRLGNPIF